MFEQLAVDARRVVVRAAEEEALALGSATVEAEHLLLALATDETGPVGRLLADAGLAHDGVIAALARETDRSLAAVGIALGDYGDHSDVVARRVGRVRFAASSKRSLHRAVIAASARKDRVVTPAHLLVGILGTEIGTVPRALEMAHVDRVALLSEAQRLL